MGRGRRFIQEEKPSGLKKALYYTIITFVVMFVAVIITMAVYNNKLKNSARKSLQAREIADLVPNLQSDNQTQTASTEIGKTIEDVIKETEEKLANEMEEKENSVVEEDTKESITEEVVAQEIENKVEEVKDPEFIAPVEGEIIKEYAKDTLVYSNTLQEWVTHLGIDIKAQRTEVVKAAEAGKVLSIKNDPRYGLTIVIEHTNGYKTVYSNLLTTEFVQEGEEVEKGQTIGTVGNSAAFEISDEPHLHFEMIKDNQNVDPMSYLERF